MYKLRLNLSIFSLKLQRSEENLIYYKVYLTKIDNIAGGARTFACLLCCRRCGRLFIDKLNVQSFQLLFYLVKLLEATLSLQIR